MYFFTKNRNKVLLIMSFFLMFQTTLFAGVSYMELQSSIESTYISEEKSNTSTANTEVELDSFGGGSMTIVLILTSILGVFFVRDELSVL